MDPRDFLVLAQSLASGGGTAEYRTAVNRAYYAAYNVAAEFCDRYNCPVRHGFEGHREVRERLTASEHPRLKGAAIRLGNLYRSRESADYRMSSQDAETQLAAAVAVRSALEVTSAIDGFYRAPEEERSQTLAALRAWLASPGRRYGG